MFYKRQNRLIDSTLADEDCLKEHDEDSRKEEEKKKNREKVWDTRLSIVTILINIVMIIAKLIVAYLSHSLAVLASMVDSAMDIASGVVIWYACRKIEQSNKKKYPVGLERLEPLTVLVVGMIMIFANLIVVEEAIVEIATDSMNPKFDIATIVVLCSGTAMKLVLFLICRVRSSTASQCLAIDHRNDCITNMVALAGALVGSKWWRYADPIFGGFISGLIIVTWFGAIREQIPMLIGRAADPELINRITKIAIAHDDRIHCIDMIHVYHFGANHLVEVHVVLAKDVCLADSHDITEGLQKKLERLPFVQRAFVHADYELDGDEHIC